MKKVAQDKEIKKIVTNGLLKKAPTGMVDRIMANIAVSPARRTSITPVEPNPLIAAILPVLIIALLGLGLVLKPKVMFSFSWVSSIELTINPIWIAPVVATALTVWGYIIITKHQDSNI